MGSARDLGTPAAVFTPWGMADPSFAGKLASALAERDDALLAAYVDDEASVSYRRLREELAAQTRRALVQPVFFGSAITGAGVDSLMTGIAELLPAAKGDVDGPVSGSVFKIERGPAGEKIAYVRMFSGTVRTRDRLRFGEDAERKVTAISVFDHGSAVQRESVSAGEIGKLWGLVEIQIGDAIGESRTTSERRYFAPPTLETVVGPRRSADKGALHVALTQLAEQDPLINVRQDDLRQEIYVSLYGEVQKEVIQATLAHDFGVDVTFRETTMICIERPVGAGAAVETIGKARNPFLATVGLRIEPAPINAGVEFQLEVEHGSIPLFVYKAVEEFRKAVEDTVHNTLREGLYGWQVTDCKVTMTQSGYVAPGSTAGDFRKLTPLVLMSALKQAGTVVCEPIHLFHLGLPAVTLGSTLSALARLRAVPQTQEMRGSSCALEGEIPAAHVHELRQQLPALTHGEGVLECAFGRYEPLRGTMPTRPRSDYNPLNREEYLRRLARGGAIG
jgi:ribosomal protection tetracycline resistance protein